MACNNSGITGYWKEYKSKLVLGARLIVMVLQYFKKLVTIILLISLGACSISGPYKSTEQKPNEAAEQQRDHANESEAGHLPDSESIENPDNQKTTEEEQKANKAVQIAKIVIGGLLTLLLLGKITEELKEDVENLVLTVFVAILLISVAKESLDEKL